MNRNTYNPVIFDLSDIIAFVIKKFLLIVLFCLIGTVVSVCFHFISVKTEANAEKYSNELAEYETTLNNAVNTLDVLESKRDGIINSMDEDPVFDMYKSKSVFVSRITFRISSNDDMLISESGNLIYPNQDSLLGFFNSLDLNSVLDSNVKNDYLRKIVIVTAQANYINISVYNKDQDVAKIWANKLYDALYSFATVDYDWTVSTKTDSTESYSGQYIMGIVEDNNASLIELEKLINDQTKVIKTLKTQRPSRFHIVKFAVIGFVIGGFLCFVVLVLIYVKRNPVTKSFNAEKKTGKAFLGALFADKGVFDRFARSVIGERKFNSENESLDYLRSSIRNSPELNHNNGVVSVLCSCSGKLVAKQVNILESVLKELGLKSVVATDVTINPSSSDVIKGSDAVIILERQWKSQWRLVFANLELVARYEKPVIGFVLC